MGFNSAFKGLMKLAHASRSKNHTEFHVTEWEKQFQNVKNRVITTQLVQVA